MPKIKETCGCGAVLDYSSPSSLDVNLAQTKFHAAHYACKSMWRTTKPKRMVIRL